MQVDLGDTGSIPGLGRSPGGGHGNPLQYSCLENSADKGVWQAAAHRVTQSEIGLKWLSIHVLGKEYMRESRFQGKWCVCIYSVEHLNLKCWNYMEVWLRVNMLQVTHGGCWRPHTRERVPSVEHVVRRPQSWRQMPGAFLTLRKAQRTRTLRRRMGKKLQRGGQGPWRIQL